MNNSVIGVLIECLSDAIKVGVSMFKKEEREIYNWEELFKFLKTDYYYQKNFINYEGIKKVYVFSVPPTLKKSTLVNELEVISNFLKVNPINLNIDLKYGILTFSIFEDNDEVVYYDKNHEDVQKVINSYKVLLGYNQNRKPIYFDISEPFNYHLGVFAATRYGKSNLTKLIVLQLLLKPKHKVKIYIIDIKKVDFSPIARQVEQTDKGKIKQIVRYEDEQDKGIEVLDDIKELMDYRYMEFAEKEVSNIKEYNKVTQDNRKMDYRVLLIEEIAGFQNNKEFHKLLTLLVNQSAATGILIIVSSQLLNKDIVTNQVRQNLNSIFGGKCKDRTKSDMIQEGANLQEITKSGTFKIFTSGEPQTVKTLLVKNKSSKN